MPNMTIPIYLSDEEYVIYVEHKEELREVLRTKAKRELAKYERGG